MIDLDDVKQHIAEFLATFTPADVYGKPISPHVLLYHYQPEYDFRPDETQVQACLGGYLTTIGDLKTLPPEKLANYIIGGLQHMDASELMLAYFNRWVIEHPPDTLLAFIRQSQAVDSLTDLLDTCVAHNDERIVLYDAVKRISQVRWWLQSILEKYGAT